MSRSVDCKKGSHLANHEARHLTFMVGWCLCTDFPLFLCRVSRLERDNNQKRTLLEDQRVKLKLAQTNAKSEQNANVSQLQHLTEI